MLGLTYRDREAIFDLVERLDANNKKPDDRIIEEINLWTKRFRPAFGFEHSFTRDLMTLCDVLRRDGDDQAKSIARKALNYALHEEDVIPDSTPVVGLVDDAFVAGWAVNEICRILNRPHVYTAPKLAPGERKAAEDLFLGLTKRDDTEDALLISSAREFCEEIGNRSGSAFWTRLQGNVSRLATMLEEEALSAEHSNWARAALRYLVLKEDAVDDSLGLVGYLDDYFIVETALDLIQPGRNPWSDLLDRTVAKWPFLASLSLEEGGVEYPISEFQLVNSALLAAQQDRSRESGPLGILLPYSGPTGFILGLLSAIGVVHEEVSREPAAHEFKLGQKVVVDGKTVVQYGGLDVQDGRKCFKLVKPGKKGTTWILGMDQMHRISPADDARRVLGKVKPTEALIETEISPLERILHLDKPLRLFKFDRSVLLVSQLSKARAVNDKVRIFGQRPSEIFPIGHFGADEDFEPWSSSHGSQTPLLRIVPDLDRARELLEEEEGHSQVLIDLEGVNSHKTSSLVGIRNLHVPTAVLAREGDFENVRFLHEKGFDIWEWEASDLEQLRAGNAVETGADVCRYETQVRKAVSAKPTPVFLEFPELESAYSLLEEVRGTADQRGEDCPEVLIRTIGNAARCLLSLARSCSPARPDPVLREKFLSNIEKLASERGGNGFLSAELLHACCELEGRIEALFDALSNSNPKALETLRILEERPSTVLVVESEQERDHLSSLSEFKDREIVSLHSVSEFRDGGAIVSGWFGKKRMASLIEPPLADPLWLLLYGFERPWHRAFARTANKLRNTRQRSASKSRFFPAVKGWNRKAPETVEVEAEPTRGEEELDLVLEQSRHVYMGRHLEWARSTGQEPDVTAKPFLFADGSSAFLTSSYKGKVVAGLSEDAVRKGGGRSSEIRLVERNQLSVGDVLLFVRGSSVDAIRQVADRYLPEGRRETATIWQKALRRHMTRRGLTNRQLWEELKACGCDHHYMTVRHWVTDDEITAPRDAHDHEIDIILKATGDEELRWNLRECHEAITEVWGAHLKASSHLAAQVLDHANSLLAAGADTTELVEIEDGVVIGRIEAILDKEVTVRRSASNCLLEVDAWQE